MADFALELSFEAVSTQAIEAQWFSLQEAGLPSQADNARGMVNAPHLSLVVAGHISSEVRNVARETLAQLLPIRLRLSGLVMLGDGARVTLAHLVEPSSELADVVERLRSRTPPVRHAIWTPHITLARRLPRADIGRAVDALGTGPRYVTANRLRWWNPTADEIATIAAS